MQNAVTTSHEERTNENVGVNSSCISSGNGIISSASLKLDKSVLTRKCSYCRNFCDTVRLCDGCGKRSYCSEICKKADWSITGNGQRHVNWCTNYECGEEDVDWEIVPVPNKGFGIIAKRFIPAGYRIMADPIYTDPNDHPAIQELAPEGADLETKFYINCIDDEDHPAGRYVGLRFSRLNHSCRPNANYVYDETTGVIIVFALKDIQSGDEICVCYWSFADLDLDRKTAHLSPEEEFQSVRNVLTNRYGIICPDDCYCRDSNARQLVLEGRRIHTEMSLLVGRGRIEEALELGEKLWSIRRRLNVSIVEQFETEYHCYQISLMRGEALASRAKGHLQNVYDFYKQICQYSQFVKSCEILLMKYA